MATRKHVRMMEENGFRFLRWTGKHPVYTDGITNIPLPTSSKEHRGMEHRLRKQIRDALKLRPAPAQDHKENDMQQPFQNLRTTLQATTADKPPQKVEIPIEKPTPTAKSYDEAWEVIRPMREAGVRYKDICERLFDMGYLTPTGKVYTDQLIGYVVSQKGATRPYAGNPRTPPPQEETPSVSPISQTMAAPQPQPQPAPPPIVPSAPIAKPKPTLAKVFDDIKKLMETDFSDEFKIDALKHLVDKL